MITADPQRRVSTLARILDHVSRTAPDADRDLLLALTPVVYGDMPDPLALRLSPEMILQLRYGRGLDNRRFKATGFAYDHSTRETVLHFGEHLRLGSVLSGVTEPYRYEKEVEDFLRWSPSVRNRDPANGEPVVPGAS